MDEHYNWHRYYDPSLGRYISADPIGQRGGLNLYTYAANNPIGNIDFNGLTTTVVITRDYGVGSHSAVRVDNGGDGEPFLYDPAGSYVPDGSGRGSGDSFYGAEANLDDYVSYQEGTGSTVETYTFDTTPAQEAAIAANAEAIGGAAPFTCAVNTSNALGGVGPFDGVSALTPGGLASQLGSRASSTGP